MSFKHTYSGKYEVIILIKFYFNVNLIQILLIQIHQTNYYNNVDNYTKVVNSNDENLRIEAYGSCPRCKKPATGEFWCKDCSAKVFTKNFTNWNCGNDNLNAIIKNTQIEAVHSSKVIEWIDFNELTKVDSKIFNWKVGNIYKLDDENDQWQRTPNTQVELMEFDNISSVCIIMLLFNWLYYLNNFNSF